MGTILAVGHDEGLLCRRLEILRNANEKVVVAPFEHAEQTLRVQEYDLLVLCHTLTEDEMALIVGMAIETQGKVVVMRLEPIGKPVSDAHVISVGGMLPPVQDSLVREVLVLLR